MTRGIRVYNQLSNLRACSRIQNNRNRLKPSNNTSGFKGVSECKKSGKFRAQIGNSLTGKPNQLGDYATPEEASEVYQSAARERFGDFYKSLSPL